MKPTLEGYNPLVTTSKNHGKFNARLRGKNLKEIWIGSYDTRKEAEIACKKVLSGASVEEVRPSRRGWRNSTSGIRDIHKDPKGGGWFVRCTDKDTGEKFTRSCKTIKEAKEIKKLSDEGKLVREKTKPFGYIHYYKQYGKWVARMYEGGKHLGYYKTKVEAEETLENAKNGIFPKKKTPLRNTTGLFGITIDPVKDKEIFEFLDNKPNKSGFVRGLLYEHLEKLKNEDQN